MTDIRKMLEEAGLENDHEVQRALGELQQLASMPAPVPSGALADAMNAKRRRRSWRTPLIVIVAVIASLGIGVSTASAVSPQFRDSTARVFDDIARVVAPPAPTATPTPTETERHGGGTDDVPGTDDNGGSHSGTDDGGTSGSGSGSSGSGSGGSGSDDGGGGGHGGSDDGGTSGKGDGGNG